jgi:magnesium-transporting ATPase (P-type)
MVTGDHPLTAEAIARKVRCRQLQVGAVMPQDANQAAGLLLCMYGSSSGLLQSLLVSACILHADKVDSCNVVQVGIVTLQTPREVAADTGVPEADIDITDEAVGAVVVTGSQLT